MAEELTKDTGSTEEVETEERVYTQAEVDELLQKETDRRVTSALRKQEQKNSEKLREAERLSKMSAEEQYRYELDKREAAIAEKERQLTLAENKNAASKILADKGLDLSLVDLVLADDADAMNANIKLLEKAFKASVKNEVENRLKSKSPTQTLDTSREYTKADMSKMSLKEMQELIYVNTGN